MLLCAGLIIMLPGQAMESDAMQTDEPEVNVTERGEIINRKDGLPNMHPNFCELELHPVVDEEESTDPNSGGFGNQRQHRSLDELINDEDLPTSLIVTNLESSIFTNDEQRKTLESIFRSFGEPATFQFFRSFRRLRVNYGCPAAAAKARIQLHQTRFGGRIINCYFAQPVSPVDIDDQRLHPPAPTKQFLISPPASPPVGWEPCGESEPLVNYELLAAIANLAPDSNRQLLWGVLVKRISLKEQVVDDILTCTLKMAYKHSPGSVRLRRHAISEFMTLLLRIRQHRRHLRRMKWLEKRDTYELHPPSASHPGIVVHVCEDASHYSDKAAKARIPQTKCPDYK